MSSLGSCAATHEPTHPLRGVLLDVCIAEPSDGITRRHSGLVSPGGRNSRWRAGANSSLRDVQDLAGHSSLATTQRYIQGDTEAKRKAVAPIWNSAPGPSQSSGRPTRPAQYRENADKPLCPKAKSDLGSWPYGTHLMPDAGVSIRWQYEEASAIAREGPLMNNAILPAVIGSAVMASPSASPAGRPGRQRSSSMNLTPE